MTPRLLRLLLPLLCAACSKPSARNESQPAQTVAQPQQPTPSQGSSSQPVGDPHQVVFADRTSQAYLLLLPAGEQPTPSREDLQALVKAKLATSADEPELALLLELIATVPTIEVNAGPSDGSPRATRDLLGMNIDMLSIRGPRGAVGAASLQDPVLTRHLTGTERDSLQNRTQALLLRAEYRNQYAVRGLRLLQTLVRVVASEQQALIYDPDTNETMGVGVFTARRLKSSLSNIADQIAVVPFPDRMHTNSVRLTTRGMRRFGSPDLELDGLPREPKALQRGSDVLNGLAYQMVRLAEFDSRGYAVELAETITVDVDDIVSAFSSYAGDAHDCDERCTGSIALHLVERAAEAHDPADHLVVRVVAPRETSDSVDYDHVRWTRTMLSDMFGPS